MAAANVNSEELISIQKVIGDGLEDLMNKYPQGNVSRARLPAIFKKLGQLDRQWWKQ
ncbi:MAG TPA: hypothetical protein VGC17_07315 [Lactovum miscens]|uniref:hypothetical protein n=1 Tax=Lactovum miscens TaxID=190387 RepID=UPI002EDBA9B4